MIQSRHRRSTAAAATALGAAVALVAVPQSARADNFVWTGGGDGVNWTDPLNWLNETTMATGLPGIADQAFIDNTVSVTIDSSVTVGSFSLGHGAGTATLNILPGADFMVNNTSRIGRGADVAGGATGHVIQTGGTVRVLNGRRLGLTFDSRTPPEVNADSIYEIRGGTISLEGTGSFQIGRTNDSGGNPITFNRAELRIVGSGASLIEANRVSLDGGAAAGTPVISFAIDSGGVTPIQLRDWIRFNQNATLEVSVISSTVPATEITLIAADHFTTGALDTFVNYPQGSTVSDIFNNRLYEWTIDYTDASDDGVIDSFVKLLDPRSFRGGDANKDGTVNLADFNILASNFGQSGSTIDWTSADFNGDMLVNLADFNVLASNFGQTGSAGGPTPDDWSNLAAAIPEPATLGLMSVGLIALGAQRRQRRFQTS